LFLVPLCSCLFKINGRAVVSFGRMRPAAHSIRKRR
jgi:hypothetical protein